MFKVNNKDTRMTKTTKIANVLITLKQYNQNNNKTFPFSCKRLLFGEIWYKTDSHLCSPLDIHSVTAPPWISGFNF